MTDNWHYSQGIKFLILIPHFGNCDPFEQQSVWLCLKEELPIQIKRQTINWFRKPVCYTAEREREIGKDGCASKTGPCVGPGAV